MGPVTKKLIKMLIDKYSIVTHTEWEYTVDINGRAVIQEAKEIYGITVTEKEIREIGDEIYG